MVKRTKNGIKWSSHEVRFGNDWLFFKRLIRSSISRNIFMIIGTIRRSQNVIDSYEILFWIKCIYGKAMTMTMKPSRYLRSMTLSSLPFLWSSIPSYDEIVNDNAEDDDDDEFDKAEEFERKFNFRYQEPDADFVCLIDLHIPLFTLVFLVETLSSNNRKQCSSKGWTSKIETCREETTPRIRTKTKTRRNQTFEEFEEERNSQ